MVAFSGARPTEKEFILGKMEKYTMESGKGV